ncbi:MAG: YraN family protein [Chloroflexi bacterium]|nr:YraN family protein [Chloroflexota bacterium]
MSRRDVGRRGEDLAVAHLQALGYRIRERNYRCRLGEIDVVAEQGDVLVVVEVKARRSHAYGTPAEAITPAKAARLAALVEHYRSNRESLPPRSRVDVVTVDLNARMELLRIAVIENAVEGS